jgi:hypothetical protein
MRRVATILIFFVIQAAGLVFGESNWRLHGRICDWDQSCMKAQAEAQDLWTGPGWDADLKAGCRKAHIGTYEKDYVAAVNCVSPLQQKREEEREAERPKGRRGTSGSSGRVLSGGKIISY